MKRSAFQNFYNKRLWKVNFLKISYAIKMFTFETALNFWWGPLSGGGPRRLPHLPHSKSAPGRDRYYREQNIMDVSYIFYYWIDVR